MKHILNQTSHSDHGMLSLSVDFKTIEEGEGIFKCPSEFHLNMNHQGIIHSSITEHLIENQPESDIKKELIKIVEAKLIDEYSLAFLRQDPSKVGFENEERFLLCKIESLGQKLSEIDDLVTMATEVNHKTLHEFILKK